MPDILEILLARYNYWGFIILMMIGLYAMISKNNLVKKIIGMSIFQTAIIFFYVSISVKLGATIPIVDHDGHSADIPAINPADFVNPLPHVLMLTAIVVAVATLGVALSLAVKVFQRYNSLEEDEIYSQINENKIR